MAEQLSAIPVATLPQALTDWSSLKAGYRFVNNKKVTHEGIIEIEQQATVQRVEADGSEIILAVQDTTSFNFANRAALSGLGVLEDNRTPGFFAHTTLAVSEQGVPLGVLGQQVWSRPQNLNRTKDAHKAKPISEKESFKWLAGLRQIPDIDQRVITVCDREADVYELFQDAHNQQQDFIVRAAQNRRLEDAPLLRHHLSGISAAATYTLTVRRQVNQAQRTATVEIRYATVTLLPPVNRPKKAEIIPLEPLSIQVVEVREINPPDDVPKPIHWILLTTLPVDTLDMAYQIVRFYTYRWLVERFHYVLKSGGCHFEDSQLRTVAALHRLLGVCSRVAWRLLWLTYQARQTPDAPCTVALSDTEWHALTAFATQSQTPAHLPPTLNQAVRMIATLGGFIGRKSDGDPGVKTLWRGWQRLQDIVATWMLFHPSQDVGND
ncbi:MAG: IS4 family transposase [Anaerohalosphaeraceae bacterium]|nr:IS4 family transposase [Anaerohalosphaeraceae bacterium]